VSVPAQDIKLGGAILCQPQLQ